MAADDEESQTSTTLGGSDVATASAAPTASNTHANGYDRLAAFMGEFPEYAIYRRFGTLNSLNLLYLQAELVMLELELKQCAAEDANSAEGHRSLYARNWRLMSNQNGGQPRHYNKQWKTALRIRKVLRQYSKSLRDVFPLRFLTFSRPRDSRAESNCPTCETGRNGGQLLVRLDEGT
jgi:hypothetical protein